MPSGISVKQVGTAHREGDDVIFSVGLESGQATTLTIPANLCGKFIQLIHTVAFGDADPKTLPEFVILRVGLARNSKDQLLMKFDTSEAHALICTLSRAQSDDLQKRLAGYDQLPLLDFTAPH